MRCLISSVTSVALLIFCFECAYSDEPFMQDANAKSIRVNASSIPRIAYPSSGASLNNVNVQVLVEGHDSWQGGPLLVVLDHGVQGLPVPVSGQVNLGIVAAGRSVAILIPLCCDVSPIVCL